MTRPWPVDYWPRHVSSAAPDSAPVGGGKHKAPVVSQTALTERLRGAR